MRFLSQPGPQVVSCHADGGGLHAAVLGLKAAAATAPYDTPAWLPEVLVALAGAASLPPPIGKVETNQQDGNGSSCCPLGVACSPAAYAPVSWE